MRRHICHLGHPRRVKWIQRDVVYLRIPILNLVLFDYSHFVRRQIISQLFVIKLLTIGVPSLQPSSQSRYG